MMNDIEMANAILNQLAVEGAVEPMAEPIDESDCHPLDWADVVGITDEIFDEMYPGAEMVDENGFSWYVS